MYFNVKVLKRVDYVATIRPLIGRVSPNNLDSDWLH